jgi:hypothetical protein
VHRQRGALPGTAQTADDVAAGAALPGVVRRALRRARGARQRRLRGAARGPRRTQVRNLTRTAAPLCGVGHATRGLAKEPSEACCTRPPHPQPSPAASGVRATLRWTLHCECVKDHKARTAHTCVSRARSPWEHSVPRESARTLSGCVARQEATDACAARAVGVARTRVHRARAARCLRRVRGALSDRRRRRTHGGGAAAHAGGSTADRGKASVNTPYPDQTEKPRSQNVYWVVSERATVVELPCMRTVA